MNTAKFPTELEETKLIDTDGYTLVSDGDGKAKKMRPSVTHTSGTLSDGTIRKNTCVLTEQGTNIVETIKDTKNGNLTHDELYLRTAEGNDVVYAQRDVDADTGNLTHDEVYLLTADGNEVVSAQRNLTDEGQLTHDEVHLRTPDGNEVVYAQRNLTDEGQLTHDEMYLRTAEGNDVVKCERTFDANGDETDKQTTLLAKSLKSLKVETDDGTFTAEQLACGSGRANGTAHKITSATQTIDIQGETIAVFETDPNATGQVNLTLENVPTSSDSNVVLGGLLLFICYGTGYTFTIDIYMDGLSGGYIPITVEQGKNVSVQYYTKNGKFFFSRPR